MRKYIAIILTCFLWSTHAQAFQVLGSGGSSGGAVNYCLGSYFCETFDGAGYSNVGAWTETGTPNENYTPPLVFGESLSVDHNQVVQSNNTGLNIKKVRFVFKAALLNNTGDSYIFALRDSAATTTLATIFVTPGELLGITCGGVLTNSAYQIVSGGQYIILFEYTKGTSGNAAVKLYVAPDTDTNGIEDSTPSLVVTIIDGPSTLNAASLRIAHTSDTGGDLYFENVAVVEVHP